MELFDMMCFKLSFKKFLLQQMSRRAHLFLLTEIIK